MIFNFDDIYYNSDVTEIIHKNVDEKMIDHIRRANMSHMNETAMIYMGVEISYRGLFVNIEKYACALKYAGLKKGDYITICLPNSPETVYFFYACNEIGVTPYLIDPRFVFEKMKTCILDSNSKIFICEMGTYFAKVADYEKELPVEKIVVVSPLNSIDKANVISIKLIITKMIFGSKKKTGIRKYPNSIKRVFLDEFITRGQKYSGVVKTNYDPNIPAIVVNTSGTSGDSVKGAIHTNRSYNIFMNQIIVEFMRENHPQIERGGMYYGYIPFFSMYGSSTCMHGALTHGAVLNLIPTFKGKESIIECLKMKSNIMIAVPAIIDELVEYCKDKHLDMSFANMYVIGGDNVTPEKLQYENEVLATLGAKHKLIYGLGTTETMMISTTSDDERSHCSGSCGIMYPNVSIIILDPMTGEELPINKEGEICVNSETLFEGYLNRAEENKKVFLLIDGKRFFRTGDKGFVSESGHLFLTGRYKRLMKRPDGHQVSPIPIENAICMSDLVEDCAIVGIKKNEADYGVIPTAYIKAKKGFAISAEEIKSIHMMSLKHLSGERESALAYCIVENIPTTENGKMDYRKLEKNDFSQKRYYVIDDPITHDYYKGMPNITLIKLPK